MADNELFAAELASVGLLASRYAHFVTVYQAMGCVDIAVAIAPNPRGKCNAKETFMSPS